MSSHGEGKNVKSLSGFPGSFRTSPPDDAFAANRWPHMGNCSSDAQPSLAQRLRHLCRARVADWVVIETTCLEAALFAATSLGGFTVGVTTSPNQGSRKEPEAEQSSSNLPEPVRTCMLHLPPLPPPTIDAAFPANRSENVRKMFGIGGPSPTPPRGCGSPYNVRKCSEMVGNGGSAPSPTPPPGRWVRLKCSEMFGNVRN